MGSSGMMDFDQYGVRRSIQLKLLHLNEYGITEVGTWSTTNRLSVNTLGIKQVTKIRKHLQVVTREVNMNYSNKIPFDNYFENLGKAIRCTSSRSKWHCLF